MKRPPLLLTRGGGILEQEIIVVICVTNRALCKREFLTTISDACRRSDMVILREKDLSLSEYTALARKVSEICKANGTFFCVNSFPEALKEVSADALQLSYPAFLRYFSDRPSKLRIGVSVHAVSEAAEAERLGADFLIAGHIFTTSCKEGVPPKGLSFLREVVRAVQIPVYGIGGINEGNLPLILETGAQGGCIMSAMMR